jgi:hypothetical protein
MNKECTHLIFPDNVNPTPKLYVALLQSMKVVKYEFFEKLVCNFEYPPNYEE